MMDSDVDQDVDIDKASHEPCRKYFLEHRSAYIISINIDASLSSLMALKEYVEELKPVAVLIQDVPMMRKVDLQDKCYSIAPDYKFFCREPTVPSKTKRCLCTDNVILIHPSIQAELIEPSTTDWNKLKALKSSVLGVAFERGAQTIPIYSVYFRPVSPYSHVKLILDWIKESQAKYHGQHAIVMGDMNASSLEWQPFFRKKHFKSLFQQNERHKEIRGRAIMSFMLRNKLNCLNKIELGPTFHREYQGVRSYIDVALVAGLTLQFWNDFELKPLKGDTSHRVIIIKKKDEVHRDIDYRCDLGKKIWHKFAELDVQMGAHYNDWRNKSNSEKGIQMNFIAEQFIAVVDQCSERIKVKRQIVDKRFRGYTRRMRRLLKKLKDSQEKAAKLRLDKRGESQLTPIENFKRLRQLSNELNMVERLKRSLMHSLNVDGSISEAVGGRRIMVNHSDDSDPVDEEQNDESQTEKTNSLFQINTLDSLEQLANAKFQSKPRDQSIRDRVNREMNYRNGFFPLGVTDEEIAAAVDTMSRRTYSGEIRFKYLVFIKSYEFCKSLINTICKISFHISMPPRCCQIDEGLLIPKTENGDFRIIHVSNPLACLLELIALSRLQYRLDINGLLSANQYAFTIGRDRHDLIARIIELKTLHMMDTSIKVKKRTTAVVALDIAKAFDNLSQDFLIEKLLNQLHKDSIALWIANRLYERHVALRHKGLVSSPHRVYSGVAQGSCLGPSLWNFAVNSLHEGLTKPKKLEILAYADDFFIVSNGTNTVKDMRELQECLNQILARLSPMRLEISPQKCRYMIFRNDSYNRIADLKINDLPMERTDTLDILGIKISFKLASDAEEFEEECTRRLAPGVRKLYKLTRLDVVRTTA